MTALETHGLGKTYRGGVVGIKALSLALPAGEVAGFVGPNGSGKTTTIRLLLDLLRATEGRATLLGLDSRRDSIEVRRRVGFLPGDLAFHGGLGGRETLDFYASLRPSRPPVLRAELLDRLGLDATVLARRVSTYSTGMRRKLGLAIALQHDPALAILDEPTTGLDPLVRRRYHDAIRAWKARGAGRALFLCTHDMLEVEALCDRVLVVREGRLVADRRVEEMKAATDRARSLEDVILSYYATP